MDTFGKLRVDKVITPVIFRVDGKDRHLTAVFPTYPYDWYDMTSMTCYAHVGQHGSCSMAWYRFNTKPALPDEYAALKLELERRGYNLKVYQRMTPRHRASYMADILRNRN